jgi:hypothetical protein
MQDSGTSKSIVLSSKRLTKVAKRYEAKKSADVSGRRTINPTLTGPSAKIPAELRLKIMKYTSVNESEPAKGKQSNESVIRAGYINPVGRFLVLPPWQMFAAWLKVMTFRIDAEGEVMDQFRGTLEKEELVPPCSGSKLSAHL